MDGGWVGCGTEGGVGCVCVVLQVLGLLVDKAGRWLELHLDELLPELLAQLGDERIAIRHHTMQVGR